MEKGFSLYIRKQRLYKCYFNSFKIKYRGVEQPGSSLGS